MNHSNLEASQGEQSTEVGELEQLRRLLFGGELENLLKRPPVQAQDVSAVLADAIVESQQQSPQFSAATVPTVEAAIRHSVKLDSNILSDALFPVIGPATRKSVSTAIRNLTQSLNQGLEHSLSPKSFQWRLEAARTGRSFAEVVMLRTLVYQVEQVLLIHRETGLLLQQVMSDSASAQDPDLVSAMLTAIQDFVKDSFNVQAGGSLDTLEFGELNIWIEEGPQAVLACVIRGNAPQELRELLQDSLEKVHRSFGTVLQTFEGDTDPIAGSRLYLEDCLRSQFKGKSDSESSQKQPPTLALITGCLLLGISGWLAYSIWAQQRWNDYVNLLNQQPGLVVIHSDHRWGSYHLSGLRDPFAVDPQKLMVEHTSLNPKKVEFRWSSYVSLDQEILLQRLQRWLSPPSEVSLTLGETGILRVSGVASQDWIDSAMAIAESSDGFSADIIRQWDFSQLQSAEQHRLEQLQARLESRIILFGDGKSKPEMLTEIEAQAQDLKAFVAIARRLGRSPQMVLNGQADPRGDRAQNLKLSQERAQYVQEQLLAQGVPARVLAIKALGARGNTDLLGEGQAAQFRSVTFSIRDEGPEEQ